MKQVKLFFSCILSIAFIFIRLITNSQTDSVEYYSNNEIRFENKIYKKGIHSVDLYKENVELSEPIIRLGQNDQLTLTFDELDAEVNSYFYTFFHCNYNWERSNIDEYDYIQGFHTNEIFNIEYSTASYSDFVNYKVQFPNDNLQFLLSGNYLLVVYEDGDLSKPVLTRRLLVIENLAPPKININRSKIVEWYNSRQEVDFEIESRNGVLSDPFNSPQAVILQNNNWTLARYLSKPSFAEINKIFFDYTYENTFEGGNEYRFFDSRRFGIANQSIAYIDNTTEPYKYYLEVDIPYNNRPYIGKPDINGRRLVHVTDPLFNSDLDAEYIEVIFSLKMDAPIKGEVFVFGELTNWEIDNQFKMVWDAKQNIYKLSALLKQGYYNYQYLNVTGSDEEAPLYSIENSYFETNNEYSVIVYMRDSRLNYDRIIGYSHTEYPR